MLPKKIMACTILHAFNWTFNEIIERLPEIKNFGYSAILTSPISYSKGGEWWMRYQPIDFRLIASPLGAKEDFINLITSANAFEIAIYVDIVINHMAHRNDADYLDYPGFEELENYKNQPELANTCIYGDITQNQFSVSDFNKKKIINNYQNIDEIRNFRIHDERVPNGLPDFALTHNVTSQQNEYLKALLRLGVKGFRIDAAKHVPIEHLNTIINDEIQSKAFVFAEVIPEQNYQIIKEVINETQIALYDFPLFYRLRKAFDWGESFKNLEAYEHDGLINDHRSVSFVTTHDIPNNTSMKNQVFHDMDDELLAYTYILGRNGGNPLIFTDKGDNQNSVDSFNNRWKHFYKNPELAQMILFNNVTNGSEMVFNYVSDGLIVCERISKGFFAINKTAHPIEIEVIFKSLDGFFKNLFSNEDFAIKEGRCNIMLDGRSGIMVLKID